MLGFGNSMMGAAAAPIVTYVQQITAKRYSGYFNDNPTYGNGTTPLGTYTLTPSNSPTPISISTAGGGGDGFTIVWTGVFIPNVSGSWGVQTTSDDGSFLWIGDAANAPTPTNATVKNGSAHSSNMVFSAISLVAGVAYPFRAIFGEDGGGEQMDVAVTPPGGSTTTNLWPYLYSAYTGGLIMQPISSQATTTQSITIASGVSRVKVKMWGGGGGYARNGAGNKNGGSGGYQYLELPVTVGDVITYAVGGAGQSGDGSGGLPSGGTSGSNQGNGGTGSLQDSVKTGGGGGGRTEIHKNGTLVGVAAGGGGGACTDGFGNGGGPGGGLTGGTAPDTNGTIGGSGATQSAPGAAGYSQSDPTNHKGQPGSGGNGGAALSGQGAGGGGGGYFGGGGGAYHPAGQSSAGGGGSSYAHATLTQNATTTSGNVITAPNTTDVDYVANAGRGGQKDGGGTVYASPGLIVLNFV